MASHPPQRMTAQWSQALALVRMSPYWDRFDDQMRRRDWFVQQASQYATYDDLPDNLQAQYQRAYATLHPKKQEQ